MSIVVDEKRLAGQSAVYRPGGDLLAAAEPGAVKLWDAATGRERLTLHGGDWAAEFLLFSPDGERMLLPSLAGSLKLLEADPP